MFTSSQLCNYYFVSIKVIHIYYSNFEVVFTHIICINYNYVTRISYK